MTETRARGRAERAALLALLVSAALTVVKLVVWQRTGSLAVLSQTLDSALDVVAMALVYLGVRVAAKPADHNHHYGHAKAENLVALAQTALLGAVAVGIVVEAGRRLRGGTATVEVGGLALALFLGTVVVDAARVGGLLAAARSEGSEALRAGALNFAGDIGTALVALASLIAARAGLALADPVGAILVGATVAVAAVGLGRRAVAVLMDRAPDPGLLRAVAAAVATVPGVAETRRVRLRGEPGSLFGDVTVAADLSASLGRAHDIADGVERAVVREAPGADVIVHVEPADAPTALVERIRAAAARPAGVFEVHNIRLQRLAAGARHALHVTLHAKVPSTSSLRDAHRRSREIEAEVAALLGPGTRIDVHMEPLEAAVPGADVTGRRADLVADVRRLAALQDEVLGCGEVLVTSSDDETAVTLHVVGHGDAPLAGIHAASQRIERAVRARHPDVGAVTVHFVPQPQPAGRG
jgi:cation diffusion facilitator family transporter